MADLDMALRAYAPAFEEIGGALPEQQVTLSNMRSMRAAAGLLWEPATEPAYRTRVLGPGREAFEKVPGYQFTTRGEGGPILGAVGDGYTVFSNAELFGIAEVVGVAALETGRPVRMLTGGETAGGKRVWLLADLGEAREVRGDPSPYVRYMTLLAGHNGGGAVKALGTQLRWFCTNALSAVEMEAAGQRAAFSFRHTTRLAQRLDQARTAIVRTLAHHDAIDDARAELLATRARPKVVSQFFAEFALAQVISKANPHKQPAGRGVAHRATAADRLEQQVRAIYESRTCEGIRDTAYGPWSAVVEYLDNVRPAESAGSRFERSMVNIERGKTLGFQIARKLF